VRDSEYRSVAGRDTEGWKDEELYDMRGGSPWEVSVAADHPEVVHRLRELAD
jgi:hypothetical protein